MATMIPAPTAFVTALFDAFEELDQTLVGYGLYAIRDYQQIGGLPHPFLLREWEWAIRPALQQSGHNVWGKSQNGTFTLTLADQQRVGIKLFKLSSVKIRKYGSQHRLDPHHDYSERWDEIEWDKWLWSLWKAHWGYFKYNRFAIRSLIFVGFDDKPDPFGKEIAALQQAVNWENHGATYQTRHWADRYGRAMWVRLSAWSFQEVKQP